jgi:hypothetical protein
MNKRSLRNKSSRDKITHPSYRRNVENNLELIKNKINLKKKLDYKFNKSYKYDYLYYAEHTPILIKVVFQDKADELENYVITIITTNKS